MSKFNKLFPPRFYEGVEFDLWVKRVSDRIGLDAPVTLQDVGYDMKNASGLIAKIHELERRINDLERSI